MSRLDRHVARVQNQLAVGLFLWALGAAVAGFCGVLLLAVVVDRLLHVGVPKPWAWFWSGLGLAVVAAIAYAVVRRPSAHQAAVAIDTKLGLAEKFSTALYARSSAGTPVAPADPFAAAAVLDAERTADNVTLNRQFPAAFPVTGYWAAGAAVVLLLAMMLPRDLDLFGREAARRVASAKLAEQKQNRANVEQALAKVAALPKAIQNAPQVQLAKAEAHQALQQPSVDATQSSDSAMKLLQEAEKANMAEVKDGQKFAEAQTNQQLFQTLNPSADDKGPVADASRDIAKGDFAKAMDKLQGLPKQFGDMTPAEQKKAAEQMQKMAAQLQNLANNPAALQNLQQQMQQMGASPQQAQQLAQTVQQAVQGNPAAQQQLQQAKQQMMQQMNGGKGPTPQQQAAINKMTQQMQAAANTQQTAQQMSGAAQAMAQAMQQAAQQQGGSKPGQQQPAQAGAQKQGVPAGAGQQQQMAGKQGGAQQGQQPGQQPGGQQQAKAGGGQPQPGQGANGGQQQANAGQQQPGGQPGQGGGQKAGGNQPGGGQQPGMAQAQQQMNEALGQMDAVQKDAQQMAAAQNATDGSAGDQPGQQGQPGNGGQGPGQMGPKPPGQGNGMGGPGFGAGGRGTKTVAQYTVKQEMDPSQKIASGRMIAKTFVKAPSEKGSSIIQFTPAAASAVKDATDDVAEESVPKEAQGAVRGYFNTIDDAGTPAAPAGK